MCKLRTTFIFLLLGVVFTQSVWATDNDYKFYARAGGSFLTLTGDASKKSSGGAFTPEIDLDDDLGLDDLEAGYFGEIGFRKGRHDFWFQGQSWDVDNTATVSRIITIGDKTFPVSTVIDSEMSFDYVYGRYGYAFKTVEEDGYRLSLNITVGYTAFDLDLKNAATGASGGVDEETPFPGIGMHIEKPLSFLSDTIFQGSLSGMYIDVGSVEGWVVDAYAGAVWRPHKNWGAFLGLNYDQVELEISRYDGGITLLGISSGIEFRF